MDDIARLAIFGGVVPLIVAAALIAPGRGPGDRERERHAWRRSVGLAAPVAITLLVLFGWPREQWHSIIWVPLAGLVAGLIMSCTSRGAWIRGRLFPVLGGACLILLWPLYPGIDEGQRGLLEREGLWLQAGVVLGVAGLGEMLEPLAVRRRGAVVPASLLVAASTAAFVSLRSGSISIPTSLIPLAVGVGVCAIAPIWKVGFTMADGPVAVVAPVLVTTPLVAMLYSSDPFPLACYLLPAAAPLLAWVGEIGPLRRTPAVATVVSLVLVAAVCGAAVLLTPGGEEDDASDPMMQMYEEMMGQ